jgi:hypothetical protein
MRASTHHQKAADQPASSVKEQSYWTTHFAAHACQYSPSKCGRPTSIFCKGAILLDHPFCCACVYLYSPSKAANQPASSAKEQSYWFTHFAAYVCISTHHQNAADQPVSSVKEQSYWTTHFAAHACQYSPSKGGGPTSTFCKGAILLDNPFCCACVPVLPTNRRPTNQGAILLDHPFCCACVPVLTIKRRLTNQHLV